MSWLEYLLDHTPRLESRPAAFGVFHLTSVALILLAAALMVALRRRLPRGERALRWGLCLFGVGLLALEIGKQVIYSYTPGGSWAYNWDRFPFQFCSTPIYVALLALALPAGRPRSALLAFLGTYSPVAGCAVLLWPAVDVFHEVVFLNVHTMLWHGSMLLFGLYLWLSGAISPTRRCAMGAAATYLPLPLLALALNEWEGATGFAGDFTFNMFYISRFGDCGIPLLSQVQDAAPYPVFLLAYIALLGMGGMLVILGMWGIRLAGRRWGKQAAPAERSLP